MCASCRALIFWRSILNSRHSTSLSEKVCCYWASWVDFNRKQAVALARGPRRLGGRSGIEALGCVEKDCHKAASKEEQGGKTCESNCRRWPARRDSLGKRELTSTAGWPEGHPGGWVSRAGECRRQPLRGEMSGSERVNIDEALANESNLHELSRMEEKEEALPARGAKRPES